MASECAHIRMWFSSVMKNKRVWYAVELACTHAPRPMFRTPKETTLITTDALAPTHRVAD